LIGSLVFYREAVLVMLPVMLQQMANSLFDFSKGLSVLGLTSTGAALIAPP